MFRSMMAGMARGVAATARFVGRATLDAAQRMVGQGAGELANCLYSGTGQAYHPVAPYALPLQRGGPALRQANLEARQQQPDRSMQMER